MRDIIECKVKGLKVIKSIHCPDYQCDGYCIYKPADKKNKSTTIKQIKHRIPEEIINICTEQFKQEDGHLYFLGLLAYPKSSECKNIANFVTSVLAEKIKALAEAGYCSMSNIHKKFRTYEKRKAERNIKHTFKRIIDKRLLAGWIALNYINKWGSSLNKTIEYVITKADKKSFKLCTDKWNFYNNIWVESKPVLHMVMAVFPMIHNIYSKGIKPDLNVSLSLVKQIKKKRELSLSDLCIIPSQTAWKFDIKEVSDLLKTGWLNNILQVAKVYYDLLPAMIPSINKEDLIKLS